jgi:hypothetical protein
MAWFLLLACAPEPEAEAAPEAPPVTPPWVVLTVHIEGLLADHPRHVDELRELIEEAGEHGVPLTLHASGEFLSAEMEEGGTVLREAQAAGHDVSVHANVYAHEGSYGEAAEHLGQLLADERALGVHPRPHASGLCSQQDWVALAGEAGFDAVGGIVAYCLRSLEDLPPAYAEYAACEDPSACHERVPLALHDRLYPWRAERGGDWLAEGGDAGLWLVPAAVNYPCAAEAEIDPAAESCVITGEDVPAVARVLEAAIADRSKERVKAFNLTWSFGSFTSRRQMANLFEMIAKRVDEGQAQWGTMDSLTDELDAQGP